MTPPDYRVHRGVLLAVVGLVLAAGAVTLGYAAPGLIAWVASVIEGIHQAWIDWGWRPL
ncbi:hypothetical protein [Actinokineospora enzanensis]|uniref:hypothetical protein n=1 Tax=Actinokineospora enzanensis TaxID=155975 RepID=UPI00036557CE|nr:hypothetical protein [Actinokineospora enzanensis]